MIKLSVDTNYTYCLSHEEFKSQCPHCKRNINLYAYNNEPLLWYSTLVRKGKSKCPHFVKYHTPTTGIKND